MKLLSLVLLALVALFVSLSPVKSSALSSNDWLSGNMIDDQVFTDANELSVDQIQSFLNSKVPNCDSAGSLNSELGGGTRAQYGIDHGNPAPFTCLKDYYEVPKTQPGNFLPANNYGGKPIPQGALSAAQIIYSASQQYRISPAVLIVKLATESPGPLTTDDWPFQKQYYYAMGAHCPDSGPNGSPDCDVEYAGFSLQVFEAASLLRSYLDNMYQPWWTYKRPGQNYVLWNVPNTGCGGSNIQILNESTAALYTYTPYQPNQAALANLYGLGDSCSAYGNRNFWRVFNDWFGPSRDRNPIVRSWQTGRMYYRSDTGKLYYITSAKQLADIGYGWRLKSYVSMSDDYVQSHLAGDLPALVRFGNNPEVYSYTLGGLRYVNYQTYVAYGSLPVGVLPDYTKSYFWAGPNSSTLLRSIENGSIYIIQDGKKRYVVGPEAYSYYNLGASTYLDTGQTLLDAIAESTPMAKPGTIVVQADKTKAGITTDTSSSLYPITTSSLQRLRLPAYTASTAQFSSYDLVNVPAITSLAKDTAGNLYILDGQQKINLSPSQISNAGYSASDFTLAPTTLLNLLNTVSSSSPTFMFRATPGTAVYSVRNKAMLRFDSLNDFLNLGYSMNDVLPLGADTAKELFSNPDVSLIPSGLLIKNGSSPSVYLVTASGGKSLIPNANLYENLGLDFGWVRTVSSATLNYLENRPPITPYAYDASGDLWLIYRGKRSLVPSTLKNTSYQLPLSDAQLTPWQLASLPISSSATKFIRVGALQNVYIVEADGTHLLSPSSYTANGGSNWTDVTAVTPELFNCLVHGTDKL